MLEREGETSFTLQIGPRTDARHTGVNGRRQQDVRRTELSRSLPTLQRASQTNPIKCLQCNRSGVKACQVNHQARVMLRRDGISCVGAGSF